MTRYMRADGVIARTIGGETVLVAVQPGVGEEGVGIGDFLVLNESAAELWACLSTPSDERELAQYLTNQFQVTAEQAHADVADFIQRMLTLGVITERTD